MNTRIEIVRPALPKAAYHVQIQHEARYKSLGELSDVKGFGQLTLAAVQTLASQDSPQGFRVVMRVGENGGQPAGEPLSLDLIGGEILRTGIRHLYDPTQPVKPTEVNEQTDSECVFDRIISGQIPVKPVLNEDGVFVFKPSQMLAAEHLLFVPTQHYRDILGVTDQSFFGSLFAKVAQFAERAEYAGGFILESNNGPWGGQVVPHLHFHMRGGQKLESPFWQDWLA